MVMQIKLIVVVVVVVVVGTQAASYGIGGLGSGLAG